MSLVEWQESAHRWMDAHEADLPAEVRPLVREVSSLLTPRREDVRIGVLGATGAGKSSLLNALLSPGRRLVPAGGVGPMTSTPVRLTFGPTWRMRAVYRGQSWMHCMLRGLLTRSLDETELGQLSLLCTGNQYAMREPGWLWQALRYCSSPSSTALPECGEPTRQALERLTSALATPGGEVVVRYGEGGGAFARAVREHASGQLAPLCSDLELHSDAELLSHGIEVVDLPGLGTAGDAYAEAALDTLPRLEGLIVVVDRSGLSDSLVEVMSRSGLLARWLDGELELVIAVTKIDQIVDSAREGSPVRRAWREHLREVMIEVPGKIYQQARRALGRAMERSGGSAAGEALERQMAEHERLVYPVTSLEMMSLHEHDGAPRVRLAESTGVPELGRAVLAMARICALSWAPKMTRALRAASSSQPRAGELYSEWLTLLDEVSA